MFKNPATMFEGYSVAIDTMDPLVIPDLPPACEIEEYAASWRKSMEFAPDAVGA
jgi:hypothetical protein